ncbi:MAG: serine hydrolase domain-containing protein, partial [Acidimicrobiales bacterium]
IMVTYPPDSRFSYSGAGFLVLQHLIEKRSGVKYSKHLGGMLASIGAKAASFDLYPPPHQLLALGHDQRGRALKGGHELVPWAAAGGLFTSATSMAEVLVTLLRGGDDVVDADLVTQMISDGLGVFFRPGASGSFVHGGDNGGFRASITGLPESMNGAVVLTNGRSSQGVTLRRNLASLVLDP